MYKFEKTIITHQLSVKHWILTETLTVRHFKQSNDGLTSTNQIYFCCDTEHYKKQRVMSGICRVLVCWQAKLPLWHQHLVKHPNTVRKKKSCLKNQKLKPATLTSKPGYRITRLHGGVFMFSPCLQVSSGCSGLWPVALHLTIIISTSCMTK